MSIVQFKSFKSLLMLGWTIALVGCNASKNQYNPPPPPEVTVANPVTQSITPFLEESGVIEAVNAAEVRARVRGFVESINFSPGQEVAEGDVLYKIEADPYQAAVNSAKATVAASEAAIAVANALVKTAEAEVKRAAQDLSRQQSLMERAAGSQAELDAAVAASDAAEASLESAMANVEAAVADKGRSVASLAQAQLDLDYTTVKSPISGRISTTDVKRGNLVENGGQLATVVDRKQVYANFSISDRQMLRFVNAQRAELKPGQEIEEADWSTIPVFLSREGDQGFPFTGTLNYVDQQGIDPDTGTLAIRAEYKNDEGLLFPGLFVTVRAPTGDPVEAMLVPEYAVLRDQRGQYVLVVNRENKAERVAVAVNETISGWAVIESGLSSDSRVVIDGLQQARPGLAVSAIDKPLAVDDETLLRGFSPSENSSDVISADSDSGHFPTE